MSVEILIIKGHIEAERYNGSPHALQLSNLLNCSDRMEEIMADKLEKHIVEKKEREEVGIFSWFQCFQGRA